MGLSREQTDPTACPKSKVEEGDAPSPASGDTDEIAGWVGAAQRGDRDAFENLVRHFQDRVWRRALYRLKDHEEAYDLAQEVFLLCFRKIHQFRGEAKFWTWLCRIVDNQVKNRHGWLKRRGKDKTYSLDAPVNNADDEPRGWDPPDPGAGPRQVAQGRESLEALNRNLVLLSDDHREILLLRFSDEQSYEEIADTLELTLGTVKSRINRARAELRALMSDHLE